MATSELAKHECVPCKGGVPPLSGETLRKMHEELNSGWELVKDHHLEKEYRFDGYEPAVDFTNTVADIAQQENHHPDLLLTYGKVKVTIWTHKIDGLTESDFYFAAKVEEAAKS